MATTPGIKYGIKLAASEYETGRKKIEGICRFKSGNLISGFTEISEANYNRWASIITPYHYWDVATEEVEKDTSAEETTSSEALHANHRTRLKWLWYEIQFTTELKEDTTDLQNEYDDLLELYQPTE